MVIELAIKANRWEEQSSEERRPLIQIVFVADVFVVIVFVVVFFVVVVFVVVVFLVFVVELAIKANRWEQQGSEERRPLIQNGEKSRERVVSAKILLII